MKPHSPYERFLTIMPGVSAKATPGVPYFYEQVLTESAYEKKGDFSVTELLDDPRCAKIRTLAPEREGQDPSKLVHSTVGTAIHQYFQSKVKAPEVMLEHRMLVRPFPYPNVLISGTADAIRMPTVKDTDKRVIVYDIKNCKVYKWMQMDFENFYWQLSIYAFLFASTSFTAPSYCHEKMLCKVVMFFMDWNKKEAAIHKDRYPPSVCTTLTFQPAPKATLEAFLLGRISSHLTLQNRPEPEWPDADPTKVWQRIQGYRVYKKENLDRAVNGGAFLLDSPQEALEQATAFLREKGSGHVLRKCVSDRVRCRAWCPWSDMCSPYQTWLAAHAETDDAKPKATYIESVPNEKS